MLMGGISMAPIALPLPILSVTVIYLGNTFTGDLPFDGASGLALSVKAIYDIAISLKDTACETG